MSLAMRPNEVNTEVQYDCKAVSYTHLRLAPEVDGVKPYIDGFEIKILGMTVYRETNE